MVWATLLCGNYWTQSLRTNKVISRATLLWLENERSHSIFVGYDSAHNFVIKSKSVVELGIATLRLFSLENQDREISCETRQGYSFLHGLLGGRFLISKDKSARETLYTELQMVVRILRILHNICVSNSYCR